MQDGRSVSAQGVQAVHVALRRLRCESRRAALVVEAAERCAATGRRLRDKITRRRQRQALQHSHVRHDRRSGIGDCCRLLDALQRIRCDPARASGGTYCSMAPLIAGCSVIEWIDLRAFDPAKGDRRAPCPRTDQAS